MAEGTLILLHSPLTSVAAWGTLPAILRARGADVIVPEVTDDDDVPFSVRYVARAALQVSGAGPLIAVGHSGAGPLLGQFGYAQRAWRRRMSGYAFIDAGLPRPGGVSRLEMLRTEDPEFAVELEELLGRRATFPNWSDRDLVDVVPDPAARKALVTGLRRRGGKYWTEPVPCPSDWPDAPCGYLRTSAAYDITAGMARARRWPVTEREGGHFAALVDPEGMADDLLALVEEM